MTFSVFARMRLVGCVVAGALFVVAGLTACTPPREGFTGLAVDADGRILAALAWCARRPPDVILLYVTSTASHATQIPAAGSSTGSGRARWRYPVPREATSPATVPLEGFPGEEKDPDQEFHMFGATHNNSFSTSAVDFRLGDLDDLRPGQVLINVVKNGHQTTGKIAFDKFVCIRQRDDPSSR